MLDIFSGLRLVVKRRSINIDNAIFRCHWFFTSTLLVSFSLIITARQYVGQPIECHSVNKLPDSLLNSYCWVQSTFSIPQACNNQQFGLDVPYPCIDNTRGRDIKVYAYYQWVGIVLFIQGLLFHLPYYLWKLWENGLIRAITGGLRVAVLNEQERAKKKEIVVEYLHDHLGCHRRYALKYFLCEFICLINLIGQLWATNKFFDGQFLRYGLDVMQYSSTTLTSQFSGDSPQTSMNNDLSNNNNNKTAAASKLPFKRLNQQVDPMTFIFPRMTKCTYYDFGSSGDVQKHDALCLLPLNIINEKIYIALWFWFLVLAILTVLVIVYRLLAIVSESVRCKGLISRCKLSNELDLRIICRHCDVGDWFLFYMVAENLDPLIMREIVASIANKIREHLELKKELKALQADDRGGYVDFLAAHDDDDKDRLKQQLLVEAVELEVSNRARRLSAILSNQQNQHHQHPFCATAPPPPSQQQTSFDSAAALAAYDSAPSQESSASSRRRNSFADQLPLVRKIKKRLYNKRLWSVDLSSSIELRQQLLMASSCVGNSSSSNPVPASNEDGEQQRQQAGETGLMPGPSQSTPLTRLASAPPASEMPLDAVPTRRRRLGSLTRTTTGGSDSFSSSGVSSNNHSSSSSSSFIMEMSTISGSSPCLVDADDSGGGGHRSAKQSNDDVDVELARLRRRQTNLAGQLNAARWRHPARHNHLR